MNSTELLNRLSEQQVQLWAEGEQLRYRAPRQALTPEMRTELVRHKSELLEILRQRQAARSADHPLSYNQLGLWFLHESAPESAAYHVAFSARLLGELDAPVLRRAWQALLDRHATLRTTLTAAESGAPRQRVHQSMEICFLEQDAAAWSEEELAGWLREAYHRPFDLEHGPLLRVYLCRRSATEHLLLVVLHHIIADGWSTMQLAGELRALYAADRRGVVPQLPPPAAPYTEYARWQRQMLAGPEGERLWAYWSRRLAGELPVLDLPADRPRPPVYSSRGATLPFTLDADLKTRLEALARREGATLYVMLLSAFAALLKRYTGQDELLIGSPAYGRNRAEFAGTVGDLMNMVVLRLALEDDPPFTALLHQARRTVLEALDHQEYPFALLVERLQPERALSRPPLVQVACLYQKFEQFKTLGNFCEPGADGQGAVRLELYPMDQQEGQFELTLELIEKDGLIAGNLKYSTDRFDEQSIARLARAFQTLLHGVVDDPARRVSELPLLDEAERRAALEAWNQAPPLEIPPRCLHELIADQARRTPAAVAVIGEHGQLTYAELNRRANRLARHLASLGVGPETLVGLCLERSPAMVVALLAILKAGGAYVPLDPAFPRERLALMLEDAQAPVLLTESRLAPDLPAAGAQVVLLDQLEPTLADLAEEDPPCAATPENRVYVIYTSGSTGRPKGVQITHRALVNGLLSFQREPGLAPTDALLAVTTLSFDIAALELWLPLLTGARTMILGQEAATDPRELMRRLEGLGATVMQATPASWRMLLDAGWNKPAALAKILCGGEALPRELADRLLATGAEVWNLYGPTETTIWSALEQVQPGELAPAIGRPVANTQLYVLDGRLNPAPLGVPGELHIGGAGLARGYLNRSELTAERFIDLPGAPADAARLYKTGDLVRRRADGSLEFLGRIDHQVKIRGFRIELGEIEAALLAHPAVGAAVAIAAPDPRADKRLLAWWVARPDAEATDEALRTHLQQRLPAYMIPSAFVRLEAFPLTPNGKVDRRALPLPDLARLPAGAAHRAPRTALEKTLAAIWIEVLRLERVGIHDNFFALGGHSLLATQVVSRMRGALACEAPLRLIFEAPTIAELAERLEPGCRARRAAAAPPIGPGHQEGPQPLSFSQQRMWFMQQLSPDSIAYNVSGLFHLAGPLDFEAFRRTLSAIAERHEALRTTFDTVDEQPMQLIGFTPHLTCEAVDLRRQPPAEREAEAVGRAMSEARKPFDLVQGPLCRFFIYRLDADSHLLLITIHHIVFDQWSFGIFIRELDALYAHFAHGEPLRLPSLPVQYSDFARWQRDWFQGEALQGQLDYWKRQLAGHRVLELPIDHPRPAMQSFHGAQRYLPLNPELIQALKDFSAREGATPFIVLLATFGILLWRYSGQEDVIIGSPIANRNRLEIEGLLGAFVNTLAMRIDLADAPTFSELLRRVREVSLDAFANQDIPFDKLVEELQPERDLSHSPIVQVLFNQFNVPLDSNRIADLTWSPLHLDRGAAQFDLALTVDLEVSREAFMEYNLSLFEAATVDRMLAHFHKTLQEVLAHPERPITELDLLDDSERHLILEQWNETGTVYPEEAGLPQLFEAQARRTPEAVAATFEGQSLTYAELNRRANQVAHTLRQAGAGPETIIGLFMERSLELLVALLGIQKAGAAYLPLDPMFPRDRLAFMLEDAGAPLLLTQERLRGELVAPGAAVICLDADGPAIGRGPIEDPIPLATPDHLAYVLYTSGSTGKPKGVQITGRALVNFLCAMQHEPGLASDDVLLAVTTLSFDIAALEIWLPLITGARVVLASREAAADGALLARMIEETGATVMQATPASWRMLLAADWPGAPRLKALCGGEALAPELAAALLDRVGELWNMYGPTETTVWSSTCRIRSTEEVITIGRPIANTQFHILDARRQPAPIGVAGELFIGGDGLSRGYLNRPELTATNFIPHPFSKEPGRRIYKTGDLARYLPDGRVVCLGRIDHQVKIRGFRIELGEIETALTEHPAVQKTVVVAREDAHGDKRLVAYLVPAAGARPTTEELRAHLRQMLPDYMIPQAWVTLERLPLTPNGKVDRRALPDPRLDRRASEHEYVAPRNPTEELIAGIWAEVLGVERVGIRDDFFALGGHSLTATRLIARLRAALRLELPLRSIFIDPTVAGLAREIHFDAAAGTYHYGAPEPKWQSLVPMQPKGSRRPFFLVAGAHANEAEFLRYLSNMIPHIGADQPVYGFMARGLDGRQEPHADVETMARDYLAEVRAFQPRGPYLLGGECVGGIVAYEMAQQLLRQGEKVGLLVLMDTHRPGWILATLARLASLLFRIQRKLRQVRDAFRGGVRAGWRGIHSLLQHNRSRILPHGPEERLQRQIQRIEQNYPRILLRYRPQPYPGKLTLLVNHMQHYKISMGWQDLAQAGLEVHVVPGDHNTRLVKYGRISAERLRACLDQAHEETRVNGALPGGAKV